jgi:uncharacterized membrane protein YdjX (TVP38/TMEM64 family)
MVTSNAQVFSSRGALRRGIVGVVALAVVLVAVSVGVRQHAAFLFDPEQLRAWVSGFGVFAPVVLVLVQATQVVVAPVPGQVVALASGYIFGPVAGSVYSLVGVLIGSAVAFSLASRFGRPAVERLLHEDILNRFDAFVDRVGVPGLLVFVLIPGLPDDAVCFLSGLTDWRLRTFIAVIAVGRLPAYAVTVYAGDGFATGQPLYALALVGVLAVTSVVGYCKQDTIRGVVERFGQ